MHPMLRAMLLGALHGAIAEKRTAPRGVELHAETAGSEIARLVRPKLDAGERRWLAEVAEAVGRGLR